jgi:hypothetical protein
MLSFEKPGINVGFLNIYAPNFVSERKEFWETLLDNLLQVKDWCMVGDFNMFEDPFDRLSARPS